MTVKEKPGILTALKDIFNALRRFVRPGRPSRVSPPITRTGPGSAPVYIEGATQEPTDADIEKMSKNGKRYADVPFEIQ